MGSVFSLWLLGSIVAYFMFRHYRTNHPRISAFFWPITGTILLLASLSNPNSSLGRRLRSPGDGISASDREPSPDQVINRPKYGLIETAEPDPDEEM